MSCGPVIAGVPHFGCCNNDPPPPPASFLAVYAIYTAPTINWPAVPHGEAFLSILAALTATLNGFQTVSGAGGTSLIIPSALQGTRTIGIGEVFLACDAAGNVQHFSGPIQRLTNLQFALAGFGFHVDATSGPNNGVSEVAASLYYLRPGSRRRYNLRTDTVLGAAVSTEITGPFGPSGEIRVPPESLAGYAHNTAMRRATAPVLLPP